MSFFSFVNDLNVTGTITGDTSLTLDSTTITTAEIGVLDGVTAGSAAASKALVLDSSTNITGIGTIGCGAITSGGNLAVTGTITGDTSLTLDSTTITTAEIGVLDSVTAGTATASKAVVLDGDKNIATIGTIGCGAITSTGTSSFGAIIPASADGGALGSAAGEWSDLYLADGGVIYFGNDQEITLTHVADNGLILKHAATADDKFPTLTLQTGDTDIAVNDKLGVINFQAPDEGTGTDAILVAAGIEAVSEGDFAADNNATKLVFKTASTGVAAATMSLSSTGKLTLGMVSNAATDTDKFLVISNDTDGEIQFRTGAEVASDIGAVSTSGNNTFSGNNTYTGSNTFSKQLVMTPLLVTSAATAEGSPTDLDETRSLMYFDLNSASAMYAAMGSGTNGQIIHIFYDNANSSGSLRIDFGSNLLRAASGDAQYLTFSSKGQSASVVFVTDNDTTSRWCIINTGAAVS